MEPDSMAIGQTTKSMDMGDTYTLLLPRLVSNTTRATSKMPRELDKETIFIPAGSNTQDNGKMTNTMERARRLGLTAAHTKDNILKKRNLAKASKYGRMGRDMRATTLMT